MPYRRAIGDLDYYKAGLNAATGDARWLRLHGDNSTQDADINLFNAGDRLGQPDSGKDLAIWRHATWDGSTPSDQYIKIGIDGGGSPYPHIKTDSVYRGINIEGLRVYSESSINNMWLYGGSSLTLEATSYVNISFGYPGSPGGRYFAFGQNGYHLVLGVQGADNLDIGGRYVTFEASQGNVNLGTTDQYYPPSLNHYVRDWAGEGATWCVSYAYEGWTNHTYQVTRSNPGILAFDIQLPVKTTELIIDTTGTIHSTYEGGGYYYSLLQIADSSMNMYLRAGLFKFSLNNGSFGADTYMMTMDETNFNFVGATSGERGIRLRSTTNIILDPSTGGYVVPENDASFDLGYFRDVTHAVRWRNLYITNYITDGTNSIIMGNPFILSGGISTPKIEPNATQNVDVFGEVNIASGVDGRKLVIHRKSVSYGDSTFSMYVNSNAQASFDSNLGMAFKSSISLNFQPNMTGSTSVSFFNGAQQYLSHTIYHYGYITAASQTRYITYQINDTTDNYELSRQDSMIGKFDVKMPLQSTNFTSNIAIGTQPYACTSTTLNTNLNADLLDNYHWTDLATYYAALDGTNSGNTTGDFEFFKNLTIADNTVGKSVYVYRKASTEGTSYLQLYCEDAQNVGTIKFRTSGAGTPCLYIDIKQISPTHYPTITISDSGSLATLIASQRDFKITNSGGSSFVGSITFQPRGAYSGMYNSSQIYIYGGDASGSSGNANGGNVTLRGGTPYGAGSYGSVVITGPMSLTGVTGGFDIGSNSITTTGDINSGSTSAFYFGSSTTDGTWRIVRDGNNLSFQRRESGAYVEKGKFQP